MTVTALLLQNELARFDPAVPPLPRPPKGQRRATFVASWNQILEHDYEAVFRIAAEVLDALVDSDQMDNALEVAEDVSREIARAGVLGRHDLVGRVYHTLLADKNSSLPTTRPSAPARCWLSWRSTDVGDGRRLCRRTT